MGSNEKLPRVGILGTSGSISCAMNGPDRALELVGFNTGNLLFQYAIASFVKNPSLFFQLSSGLDIDWLKDNIDVLVIPASNQLNPDGVFCNLEWWCDLIEKVDKPVVVVGLGIQSEIDGVSAINLPKWTVRFIHLLRERATLIGVRGNSSRELLERYRVFNSVVTGCPSNFLNKDISGKSISSRIEYFDNCLKPSICYLPGTLEEFCRGHERSIFDLVSDSCKSIIFQTNSDILKFLLNSCNDKFSTYIEWERSILAPENNYSEYQTFLKSKGRFFFSASSWIDYASSMDLTIGMRFHGAMAAIQGGSLGVCIAFDSRTLELVNTMGFPYILADDLKLLKNISNLRSIINFDPNVFDDCRKSLAFPLLDCLNNHGVLARF
jgi:hypothetical protein